MDMVEREIENLSHRNKKGVKDIFDNVVKKSISREGAIDFRKEDYKQFLKFIDVSYKSISSIYEKNILSKLDDYSYEKVKEQFSVICRNVSYDNFSIWIRNNKDEFSLYNINAKSVEDKYLQIAFYEHVKQIMFYVYESMNYDSYGIVKSYYDNDKRIYELLRKEVRYYDKREFVNCIYNDVTLYELEIMFNKLIGRADRGDREDESQKEIVEEMYNIVEEILSRPEISKAKRNDYYIKKRELFVELRKIKNRSMKEEYRIVLRNDIRKKRMIFEKGDDPKHIEIVRRCVDRLEQQPKLNIDEVIDEVEREVEVEFFEIGKDKRIIINQY